MAKKAKRKLTPFEQSFATARANKLSTFAYKGKSYSTKRADAAAKTPRAGVQKTRSTSSVSLPKTAPVPTASPNRGKLANPPPPGIRFAAEVPTPTRRPSIEPTPKFRSTLNEPTVAARPVDAARTAADIADTRKRVELVTGSPSHRGTPIRHAKANVPTATRVSTATTVTPRSTATKATPLGFSDAIGASKRATQVVQRRVSDVAPRVQTSTRQVVTGKEVGGITTAKTGRLKNTNMARTGDRLGSQAPVAAVNPFESRKVKTTRIKTKTPARARFGY